MSFPEFIAGCEQAGIKFSVHDFKYAYDAIDYDAAGEVNFQKFCLLNTD